MYNLTHKDNFTEPELPENPLIYFKEYNNKLLLWISPLLVLTIWVNIYLLFNIIIFFVKMYNNCVEKRNKSICTGKLKCKKGCRKYILRDLYLENCR